MKKDDNILDFNVFLVKEQLEEGGVPLFLSNKLLKVLLKIGTDPIAAKIINATKQNKLFDLSYLDCDKDSKMVTYMPKNRLEASYLDKVIAPPDSDPVWTSSKRQPINWGKMVNRLFPDEFNANDIDRFYNRYRPEIDISEKENARFKVVHGEEIRYWYLNEHWDGSFGSCMQSREKQPYFDYYCHNPEKCGLLIYFSERRDDRIIGRGLVWNNLMKPSGYTAEDKNPYTLLDRVYFVDSNRTQIEAAFHKYAIDHNWIYKQGDQFLMNGIRKTTSVTTRLKPIDFKYYPYVDTMAYYTPSTGRAASIPGNPARDPNNPSKTFPRYSLKNQNGSKSPLDR